MSEDTPGNLGVAWPASEEADLVVRRMQIKLHRWASGDSARRFDDLFNLVYDPAFLVAAWQRVRGNVGARTPGVDRATVGQIESRVGVQVLAIRPVRPTAVQESKPRPPDALQGPHTRAGRPGSASGAGAPSSAGRRGAFSERLSESPSATWPAPCVSAEWNAADLGPLPARPGVARPRHRAPSARRSRVPGRN